MNRVSNIRPNGEIAKKTKPRHPKGNGGVAGFFKPGFLRVREGLKPPLRVPTDTRRRYRSARSAVPLPHPCPTRIFNYSNA